MKDLKDRIIQKQNELIIMTIPCFNGFGKERTDLENLIAEIQALEAELKEGKTAVELVREAFQPIQQGQNMVVNEAGKEEDKCTCNFPNKAPYSNFCRSCNRHTY